MPRIRTTLALITSLTLASAALASSVLAQDETDRHPLVGTWMVNADPEDLIVFGSDGTIINASPGETAIGAWEPTGDATADITLRFVPAPESEGGRYTIRGSLEVAENGSSFTAAYTFEPSPELAATVGWEVGELGPGEVTAERMTVEPMGEPVGPLPEFDVPPAEGSPEASPTGQEAPGAEESPST